jgi:hypothetical protein
MQTLVIYDSKFGNTEKIAYSVVRCRRRPRRYPWRMYAIIRSYPNRRAPEVTSSAPVEPAQGCLMMRQVSSRA